MAIIPCNTCIFAFEGLGSGLQGILATTDPNHHEKLGYLKAMMIVTKGRTIKYVTPNATTLPDNRPDVKKNDECVSGKITTLQNGIYKYHTGKHKGYTALVPDYGNGEQNWPAWYLIDSADDFHSDICKSVNLHASGQNPKKEKADANSMGCQTVYISDYFKFGQAVGFLSTSLTETPQTGGITSYLQGKLGYGNKYEQYIKATYILDRTYDEKNNYYFLRKEEYQDNKDTLNDYEKCFNGVFYPINHNDCSPKENYKCTKCPPKES